MITYTVEALTTRRISPKYYIGFSLRESFLKTIINKTCGLNFCNNCSKLGNCRIGYFLYPLIIERGKKLHLPRPYILMPYKIVGDKIFFKIILIKEFLDVDEMVSTILNMGEYGLRIGRLKSYFSCIKIYAEDILIYNLGKIYTHSINISTELLKKIVINNFPTNVNYIKINFVTPFQIYSFDENILFYKIYMNIVRRYTLLSEYFNIGENIDGKNLGKIKKKILSKIIVKKADFKLKFFKWFSLSLNKYIKTPAYIGNLIFKINTKLDYKLIRDILITLKIGEIIGIGKNASAGLGRYNFRLLNKIN